MPTLFFVRSEVGFVPVFAEAGSIITPDMVEKHPSVPTLDQIDTLTIPQIKRLWNAMGKRLIKKTGKSAFLVFLMNNWEGTMEHGFGIEREYHEYTTGTPVVMFWKTPEIFYSPFMVYPAEVIPISFFRSSQIEWTILTPEMLNGLTKKQIVEIQVDVLDICPSGAREEKGNFIRDTVEAWDFQYRSFLENNIQNLSDEDEEASTSDGENSIHTIHNEADELSEIEVDEDIPNIEDFVLMTSEEGNETDPIVINDPSDFINDPFEVKVKEFGGKLLFRLIIQKGTMTVYEFKTSIVQTIQRRAVMKGIELDKVLKADDFKLIGDGRKLEETDPLKVNEVFIQLFIRGGGKTSKITKKDMLKKCATVLKDKVETFKGLKVPDIKLDDIKKTMMSSLKDGEDTLTAMIAKQDTKTILTLLQSLKGNNIDVKTVAISKAMFSNELKEIDKLLLMADEVKETANAVAGMLLVKQYTSENGSINWKQLVKDVSNSIIKKSGAMVEDTDADIEDRVFF